MRLFLSNIFLLLGIFSLLLVGALFWQRTNPQKLAFDYNQNQTIAVNSSSNLGYKPVQITIQDLEIDLPIYPAGIKNNQWEATTKGVSYLVSSPLPGEEGNSILYGHNWPNRLGNLKKAKPGQEIKITFDNGETKIFTVESTQIVSPNQSQILDQTPDRRLTVYTCTGFWDSKRFVAVAILKKE